LEQWRAVIIGGTSRIWTHALLRSTLLALTSAIIFWGILGGIFWRILGEVRRLLGARIATSRRGLAIFIFGHTFGP